MGLLSKTVSIEKKEKQKKKSGGLLARALSESGAPEESGDTDIEDASSEHEGMEDSEAEIRTGGGLLQRANTMAEEFTSGIAGAGKGTETAESVEEEAVFEQERHEEAETPAPSGVAAEKEGEEHVSERGAKTFAVLCEQAISEADSVRLLELFEDIVRSEGYTSFFSEVSDVFKSLARGKSVILYIRSDAKYTAEYFDPQSSEVKKCAKKTFRIQSKLIDVLKEQSQGIRSFSLKDDAVLKETSSFGQIEPWMLIPLGFGERQHGFVVVGNQPKRPRIDTDGLIILAHLAAQIVVRYSEEKNHAREIGRLEKESAVQENLLQLSALLDTVHGGVKEALKVLCESLGIEAAVILKGWSDRGRMSVVESVGLPEKIVKSYTLSKSDREIKKVVENGEPALLKDAEKRCAKLSKQKGEQLKTFIVVPIRFGEAVLGILTVHRMKGVGKKLPKGVTASLAHGAKNLVPFILQGENAGAQPFDLVNEFVHEHIEQARERRGSLHFIVFLLHMDRNQEAKEDRAVFFDLVQKTHEIIMKVCSSNGMLAKRVDLTKSLSVLDDMNDVEADETIKKVRCEFGKILARKKKESQFTLTSLIIRYPQDTRDPHEILEWIYRGKGF
jgi:transcriptional regulator with GAF, ATPase, and Fis domain